jgi:7-cyano-7-deazaguanine synthase
VDKAIVLLSGGQDSTTALFWALAQEDLEVARCVSFDYGQRHRVELEAAERIAARVEVPHLVLSAHALNQIGGSALVDPGLELAGSGGHADTAMPDGLPTSFVPGRNLLFLALAGSVAVRDGARVLVTGVCQTDFSGYPDCRRSFIDAMEAALTLAMPSSAGPLRIETPLMRLTKAETVRMARGFGSECWEALGESVTCYRGKPACRVCPACELRAKGFAEAGFADPAV